ncbi:MAG: ArgR family transcriptional regulator [Vagococcus sp.]|jgi:transcriptional regulator of arginine metabolism|nr:ArgR family transcriptional regulator [Vagococcus sp.]
MNKKERHFLIKQIISQEVITNQTELIKKLNEKKVDVTQATISRDIKELKITKINDSSGVIKYGVVAKEESNDSKLREVFNDYVSSIVQVKVLNVLKTSLGEANIVAAELDEMQVPEIVGTIAGTDTLVLFSGSEIEAEKLNNQLLSYLK